MKNLIIATLLLVSFAVANAQTNELIGQYYLNMPAYNPAHVGTDNFLNVTAGFRQQWTGFSGSPYGGFISAYSALNANGLQPDSVRTIAKHGIGGYLMTNGQGPFKQNEVALLYAYHIPVAKNTYLSLGMSPAFYAEKIGTPQLTVEDPNDAAYQSLINQGDSYNSLQINTGLSLHSQKFYLSYSLREAVSVSLSGNEEVFGRSQDKRHHFLGGYTITVNEKFDVIPNTFVRIDKLKPALLEFGVRGRYNQNMWAGLSYRNDNTMVGSLGFIHKNKFQLGYAFEYKRFGISQYARGTHEIVVGLRVFKVKKQKVTAAPVVVKSTPPVVVEEIVIEEPIEEVAPKTKVLSTTVKAQNGEVLNDVALEVKNLSTQEAKTFVISGLHKVDMIVGNDYQITATKEGYMPEVVQIISNEHDTETVKTSDIMLKKVGLFKKLSVGEMIEMDIRYDVNKATVKSESLLELDKLAELLKNDRSLTIEIGSHTDARGSNEANQTLSQKRSEAVAQYLVSKGVDKSQLTAKGYGETKLKVADAKSESDHAQNRRTTIKIVGN